MDERNHVYIVNVNIPKYKNEKKMIRVKKWVRQKYKDYLETNSTVYTKTQINDIINSKYKRKRSRIKFSFAMDVSEKEAFNAMSASSMEAKLDDIKPLYEQLPYQSYLIVHKPPSNFNCPICLEKNSDKVISLKRCKCIFHRNCIKMAHTYDRRCPLCSKKMCRISKEPVDFTI